MTEKTGRRAGAHAWARQIKCVIFDVDGVLTDGLIYCDDEGREHCAFHIHDGLGVKRLLKGGVGVAVISGRASEATARRMRRLGVSDVHLGVDDKIVAFEKVLGAHGLKPEEVAYMGDDLIDLPVMERCGMACAPADARDEVKATAGWIAATAGGRGAVRELCDLILRERGP